MKNAVSMALALGVLQGAFASSGNPETKLAWPNKAEVLMYHSCGCADACWVAEVRDKKSRRVKQYLSCDCEVLHFGTTSKKAETSSESCTAWSAPTAEMGSKDKLIENKMKKLLGR